MSKFGLEGFRRHPFAIGLAAFGLGLAAIGIAWGPRAIGSTAPPSTPADEGVHVYDDELACTADWTDVPDPTVAEFGPSGAEVGLVCCEHNGRCMYYPVSKCPDGLNPAKCPCASNPV